MPVRTIFIFIAVAVVLFFIVNGITIVPQSMAYVAERLGGYFGTWTTGVHFKLPFIDRIARKISLKEQVVDFDPQAVITSDNVTMQIDTVVFLQVTDPKLYTYGVEYPMSAIENLTATTLRNIIGDMELDGTLTSRDVINASITSTIDEATDKWGVKVNRVELRNILPPREIQEAMERQMKAERERREQILRAEGEKKSSILVAEGLKESEVLRAEAEKEAAVLRGQADKIARILRAEAVREQKIQEAQGEAQAIREVQQAYADSLEMIKRAEPSEAVIRLRTIEALEKLADGKATKIIIPSEIQNLSSLAVALKESITDPAAEIVPGDAGIEIK